MRRGGRVLVAVIVMVSALAPLTSRSTAGAADAPVRSITVTGVGSTTFPAFTPSVDRYAVRPGPGASASLVVQASTSDPAGQVRVNGRLVTTGPTTLDGLTTGEEISVSVKDAAGTTSYSFIVVPPEFPVLRRTTGADARVTEGEVLLTLGKWLTAGSFFEAAVDENGVPVQVQQTPNSMDLRRQPNGHYSVSRGGDNGGDLVELDEQFREVRRWRTNGLVNTDGHDAILLPDGSAYLMAYEPNTATGRTDAVIQHLSSAGDLLFEWNSADHVHIAAETVVGTNADYAHINSFQVMADGDLLVSFRNLSSVFKIARHAHDSYAEGDVVWRLGGRASDFTFTDAAGRPDGGPCAQHTATQLPNGDVMVFDNGAWNVQPLCINPADPAGPPVPRIPSRIVQWSLDEGSMTASTVKDFKGGPSDAQRYAIFAGSAQPLEGGNTVVGWASATQAVASEYSPTGEVLWEITAPDNPKYFTYRAQKTSVPDAIDPVVGFLPGADRSVLTVGDTEVPDVSCTDRGGSNLQSCNAVDLDTSAPGQRTMTLVARDGAGNETRVRRDYTVVAAPEPPTQATPTPPASSLPPAPTLPTPATARHRPDLHLKAAGGSWAGVGKHDVRRGQTVAASSRTARSVFRVRLRNDGAGPDRFRLRIMGRGVSAPRWVLAGKRSPRLAAGESLSFRIVVQRGARPRSTARIAARSTADHQARDRVRAVTRWR